MQEENVLIDYYLFINGDDFIGICPEAKFGEIKFVTKRSKGGRLGGKSNIVNVEPFNLEVTIDGRNDRFLNLLGGTYDVVLKAAYSDGDNDAIAEEYSATVQFEEQDLEAHKAEDQNSSKLVGDVESYRHVFGGKTKVDYKKDLHSFKVNGVERFPGVHAALN